jgi:hypothetical protein
MHISGRICEPARKNRPGFLNGNRFKKEMHMNSIISFTLNEILNREVKASNRGDYPVTILLVSVTHSSCGNISREMVKACEIVSMLKTIFKSRFRETDLILDYGGDKLILILPFLKKANMPIIEDKIRSIYDSNTMISKLNKEFVMNITSVTCPDDGKILQILQDKLEKQ